MTLLGDRFGNVGGYPQLFARSGGVIDYPVESYESYVRSTGGATLANYTLAAHRGSYMFFDENWPDNSQFGARWQRDASRGRVILFSAKTGGMTWAQFADGSGDALIDARGAQLKTFWDANPQMKMMCFTFHHEPNNGSPSDGATASISGSSNEATGINFWWRALERIVTRWEALGVPTWVGTQSGVTSAPGMVYAGPNIAGAAQVSGPAVYDLWYKTPATEEWGWDNMQMCCHDMYQGSANGNGTWRAFPEMAGATSSRAGFVSWSSPKVASQNALGKVLLRSCWEFACDEIYKRWPEPSGWMFGPAPFNVSTYWTGQVQTTPSQPNFLNNAVAWLTLNPSVYHSICFWDSSAGTGSRGPHMIDVGAADGPGGVEGTQAASWTAWLNMLKSPVISNAAPEPPDPPPDPEPGTFTPGLFSVHQRTRLS